MKTIFLSYSIGNSSVTDFFVELSNKLSKEYKVIIITDYIKDHSFYISPEITIYQWPSSRPTEVKDFIFLSKKVRKYRPETMISIFGAVNLFLLVGYLFGVKRRIVWRRSISTQFEPRKKLQLRKKYFYRLATTIVANSKATKQDLVENFGVNESKIEIVYNAVRDYEIPNTGGGSNNILYVGRMHPSKGVETLLEAMPAILSQFPDIQLVLLGGYLKGIEIQKYEKISKILRIEKNVSFLGNQPKQRVLEELSSAYVAVVPSIIEAFGFVVIESFSVKTPVIGSNTSGIAEIIRKEKDGFLFETRNAADLSKKIISLFNNREMRQTLSSNCYKRFRDDFEIKSAVDRLYFKLKEMK